MIAPAVIWGGVALILYGLAVRSLFLPAQAEPLGEICQTGAGLA